jgi:hypothetical protein
MKVRGVDRKPCPRSDLRSACVVSQKTIPIALPFIIVSPLFFQARFGEERLPRHDKIKQI